jgi:hypothetical protein
VTSNGGNDAIVWILVGNVGRSTPLVGLNVPHPVLYALDPSSLHALWISTPSMLQVGGKYNTPAFGPGMVFVGTDRIQTFGIQSDPRSHLARTGRNRAFSGHSLTHRTENALGFSPPL